MRAPSLTFRLVALLALQLGAAAAWVAPAHAQWTDIATISSTLGNNASRLCVGGGKTDLGCPVSAPYLDMATGNLSIGTTSPTTYKLNVAGGTTYLQGGVLVGNVANGVNSARITSGLDSATYISFHWGQPDLTFYTNNARRMTIASGNLGAEYAGRVGIGSMTYPSATLHVSGTIRMASGGEACDANRTGAIRYQGGIFQICQSPAIGWEALATTGENSTVDRITSSSMAGVTANATGYISLTTGGVTGTAYFTPASVLVNAGVSATNTISASGGYFGSMRIGQTGAFTNAISPFQSYADIVGNYTGIGGVEMRNQSNSTNAEFRFMVSDERGAGGTQLAFSMPSSNNTTSLFGIPRNLLATIFVNATNDAQSRALALGTLKSNPVIFATNNAERMRIAPNGNVGIGTTSPSSTLHVIGDIRSSNDIYIPYGNSLRAGSFNYTTLLQTGWNGWADYTALFTPGNDASNALPRMTLLSNGNVGIGTTTPTTALQVSGTLRLAYDNATCDTDHLGAIKYESGQFQICRNGTSWETLIAGNSGTVDADRITSGTTSMITYNNDKATIATAGVERVVVGATGGVGIGQQPAVGLALAVSGNTSVSGRLGILTPSGNNVFAGSFAGANATGTENTGFGQGALQATSGNSGVGIGRYAGQNNTGANLAALGAGAAQSNSGNDVTAVGLNAAQNNNVAYVTALGTNAAQTNTGSYSVMVGNDSGQFNAGTRLSALGVGAAQRNTAANITAMGSYAAQFNSGADSTAIGYNAGQYNSGLRLTAVGQLAANKNTADQVTAIGYNAVSAVSNTFSNITGLGYDAQPTKSNQIMLGNTLIDEVFSYGAGVFGKYIRPGGQTTALMTSATLAGAGAIMYDTTLNSLRYSDGTQWNTLVGQTGASAMNADRIISGTTAVVANTNGNTVSITTAGTTTSYFHSTIGLVTPGVSATGTVSSGNVNTGLVVLRGVAGGAGISLTAPGDNLGNHLATQNLDMAGFDITKVGHMSIGAQTSNTNLLSVRTSSGKALTDITRPSGSTGALIFGTYNGTTNPIRWGIGANQVAETGSNSGSNFFINRHDDAGTYLDTPFSIIRNTGVVQVTNVSASGNIQANQFIGDGSGLTNINAANVTGLTSDRITSGTTSVVALQNDAVVISANNAERMRILPDGTVGIGRQYTGAHLDVSGSIRSIAGSTYPIFTAYSTNGDVYPPSFLMQVERTGGQPMNGGQWLGSIAWRGQTGEAAGILVEAAENHSGTSTPANMMFRTTGTGTTDPLERMRITESGNIGIGTNDPKTALHVSGTLRIATGAEACDSDRTGAIKYESGNFLVCRNGSSWETLVAGSSGSVNTDRITSGTTSIIAYDSPSKAAIATASVERVVVNANGEVGIAQQPSSGYSLSVSGTTRFRGIMDLSVGTQNLPIGANALRYTTGIFNVGLGDSAGRGVNGTSNYSFNTMVGANAGYKLTSGGMNTLLGYNAGTELTSGTQNVFVGYGAGDVNTTGTNNVFVGFSAGAGNTSGSNNIFIGAQSWVYATGSNMLAIGNFITGHRTSSESRIGINIASATTALEVSGTISGTTLFTPLLTLQGVSSSAGISMTSGGGSDNLGNHTATQNLSMGGNSIVSVTNVAATGSVQAGNADTVCSTLSDYGKMRFNPTTKKMFMCRP